MPHFLIGVQLCIQATASTFFCIERVIDWAHAEPGILIHLPVCSFVNLPDTSP